MITLPRALVFCWLAVTTSAAQQNATLRVDAGTELGPVQSSWAYFGYDEANFTYTANGKRLIHELAALSKTPVHIRTHFLLATGNGQPMLKFGSTNVYTEDASGKPVYDWTVVDRILGTYVDAGVIPFVEIGFMPEALSTHPNPYMSPWVLGAKNPGYFAGWTYPPKDYRKWADLIYAWVRHSIERFGEEEVAKWQWEVWNEPDIGYWHGTPDEYDKLYDFTAAAVKRALPDARVGGPASTGPGNKKAADFLQQFLEHCSAGKNYASGETGAPLDFISFHVKGRPELVNGNSVMGLRSEMRDASNGFAIIRQFARFAHLPIILSEADPEGCAACSARFYPQNRYRNGTLYAAYEAAAYKTLTDLAHQDGLNLQGILAWAFEFEGQPYFAGFRTLSTNGIDKPVLNFFRMAGLLTGRGVKAESTQSRPAKEVASNGVRQQADVDAVAAKSDRRLAVMVWNYHDDATADRALQIQTDIRGIPTEVHRVLVRQYRIDDAHSNAYTAWERMGSPQQPTPEQYARVARAGQLELLGSPQWMDRRAAESMELSLPPESVSLVEISW